MAFENVKRFLLSLDKGLYFPLFLTLTVPLVWFLSGWVATFFYTLVTSFLHRILLDINPYVKESNYYLYMSLKERFYEDNIKYPSPLPKKYVLFAQVFLLLSYFWMFSVPEFSVVLFPLQVLSCFIYTSSAFVDILNIIARPVLPEKVLKYHPVFQRRYGPLVDVMINKVIPLCGKTFGIIGSTYIAGAGSYKALNGVNAIDPVRNFVLNKYHSFPPTYEWNEGRLSAWSFYKSTASAQELSYLEKVKVFQKSSYIFETNVDRLVQKAIEKTYS